MRRYKLFLFLTLILAFSKGVALPQGHPSMPEAIEDGIFFCKDNFVAIKGGYLGDVVWKWKEIETQTKGPDATGILVVTGGLGDIHSYHSESHYGILFFNILNQFEVYGMLGSAKGEFSHTPSSDNLKRTYHSFFHPSWGVGIRVIAFYWKRAILGFDAKYIGANLPLRVHIANEKSQRYGSWRMRRWQGAGALSFQLGFLAPYVGVRYSEIKDEIRNVTKARLTHSRFYLNNRARFGGTIGLGIFPGKYWAINFEGRLFDEEAFSTSFDFKF